jgi:hypothetical protein
MFFVLFLGSIGLFAIIGLIAVYLFMGKYFKFIKDADDIKGDNKEGDKKTALKKNTTDVDEEKKLKYYFWVTLGSQLLVITVTGALVMLYQKELGKK